MDPSVVTEQLAGTLMVLLLAAMLGMVWALVGGVMLVQGRRLPPAAVAAAVALPALVGQGAAAWALSGLHQDPERAIGGAVAYQLVTLYFTLPAACSLMLPAAIAGVRSRPRETTFAMAAAALAAVAAGVPVMGGLATGDPLYAVLRGAIHGVLGVMLVLAALGSGDEEHAGREAAAAAALAFAVVVALSEASGRGLIHLFLTLRMGDVQPADQPAYIAMALERIVDRRAPYHWIAVAASAGYGLGAAVPLLHDRARRVAGVAVVVAALVTPALFLPGRLDAPTLGFLVGLHAPAAPTGDPGAAPDPAAP